MDDNLDINSTNQEPEKKPKEDKKRIDSIPLWLQGISENAAASREPEEGEWQKEQNYVANQETGPTSIELTDAAPWEEILGKPKSPDVDSNAEHEIPLPNWIAESEETVENEITSAVPLKNSKEKVEEENEVAFEEIIDEVLVEQTETTELTETWEPEIPESTPSEDVSTPSQINQGFEEIEFDKVEAEIGEADQDEILSETEEIPEWLREMIAADEKQKEADERNLISQSDEPTQPVILSPAEDKQENIPSEENEIFTKEELSITEDKQDDEEVFPPLEDSKRSVVLPNANFSRLSEDPKQEEDPTASEEPTIGLETGEINLHLERDFNAEFDGSGFEPIQFDPPVDEEQPEEPPTNLSDDVLPPEETVEAEEPEEIILEDWGTPEPPVEVETAPPMQTQEDFEAVSHLNNSSEELMDEFPESLNQARKSLEKGEIKEALKIIKSYIGQSQYLNEIKDWLLTANEKIEKNKSSLWEALGDISSHQGDYPNALNAYAKAIEYLELSRKSHNEIG